MTAPNYHYVVTMQFKDYSPGDQITDAEEIAAALETHPNHMVRVLSKAPAAPPK